MQQERPPRCHRAGGKVPPARDLIDPAAVVSAMAAAVRRVRRMAATVFEGDAALFGKEKPES